MTINVNKFIFFYLYFFFFSNEKDKTICLPAISHINLHFKITLFFHIKGIFDIEFIILISSEKNIKFKI